jgi:carbonic anhydrase
MPRRSAWGPLTAHERKAPPAMQALNANALPTPSRWLAGSLVIWSFAAGVYAADKKEVTPTKATSQADIEATTASNPKDVGSKVREALGTSILPNKKLIVNVNSGKGGSAPAVEANPEPVAAVAPAISASNRRTYQARAAAVSSHAAPAPASKSAEVHGGEVHWAYEGEGGPQAWGRLKPEFNLCATGRRQSPIGIDDSATLQGPAEPIQFSYVPSNGTVVNNGHTIQVDVQGDNTIMVRGSSYRLLQFHFHTPSEEQINFKRFPMVAHLVHRNMEGQLAVVAVLLDVGAASPLIDKVWTFMPLDAGDRVRMPNELLNLAELLPTDQRYYQFMGSLTTPPCSEGVLWMVLKAPMTVSKAQLKLFSQLYPNNARPIQPLNARPVRDAQ